MRLLIAGAGGHGCVVADAPESAGAWDEISFLDDRYPSPSKAGAWEIVGALADLPRFTARFDACIVAIADARWRLDLLESSSAAGFSTPVIAHPRSSVSRHARLAAVARQGGSRSVPTSPRPPQRGPRGRCSRRCRGGGRAGEGKWIVHSGAHRRTNNDWHALADVQR